jgi:hypothetical protein
MDAPIALEKDRLRTLITAQKGLLLLLQHARRWAAADPANATKALAAAEWAFQWMEPLTRRVKRLGNRRGETSVWTWALAHVLMAATHTAIGGETGAAAAKSVSESLSRHSLRPLIRASVARLQPEPLPEGRQQAADEKELDADGSLTAPEDVDPDPTIRRKKRRPPHLPTGPLVFSGGDAADQTVSRALRNVNLELRAAKLWPDDSVPDSKSLSAAERTACGHVAQLAVAHALTHWPVPLPRGPTADAAASAPQTAPVVVQCDSRLCSACHGWMSVAARHYGRTIAVTDLFAKHQFDSAAPASAKEHAYAHGCACNGRW